MKEESQEKKKMVSKARFVEDDVLARDNEKYKWKSLSSKKFKVLNKIDKSDVEYAYYEKDIWENIFGLKNYINLCTYKNYLSKETWAFIKGFQKEINKQFGRRFK